MEYKVQNSERIFQGKAFGVRIDEVSHPSGRTMRVEVVEHTHSVTIIPIDEEDRICFVRQFRQPTHQDLLELPAGTLEPDETPEACARRECREEIGMEPARIVEIGAGFLAPGYSTEFMYFFLAHDLSTSPLPPDKDEDIKVQRLSFQETQELIRNGELRDIKTMAGLYLASHYINRP